jgi:hypothetical protein
VALVAGMAKIDLSCGGPVSAMNRYPSLRPACARSSTTGPPSVRTDVNGG